MLGGAHFAQVFLQIAQRCVAERFGGGIRPWLNGIAVNGSLFAA